MTPSQKYRQLQAIFKKMGSVLVAFSGGVDSSLCLLAATEALGQNVLAVTAGGPIHFPVEQKQAKRIARMIHARHQVIRFRLPETFWRNPTDRCFHCKKALFVRLKRLAGQKGFSYVADGSHHDDEGAYRPGRRALRALGVRSPLQEAGLTKEDIRYLARKRKLPNWAAASQTCLATRFPYGQRITPRRLETIGRAEAFLRALGFENFRVRFHGTTARIEVPQHQMSRLLRSRFRLVCYLKRLGFVHVTADLEGYRSGSFDEALTWKKKK